MNPLSRPSATLSPPCGERAGRGVPIWFMAPIHARILEMFPSYEPGGVRPRRALISVIIYLTHQRFYAMVWA